MRHRSSLNFKRFNILFSSFILLSSLYCEFWILCLIWDHNRVRSKPGRKFINLFVVGKWKKFNSPLKNQANWIETVLLRFTYFSKIIKRQWTQLFSNQFTLILPVWNRNLLNLKRCVYEAKWICQMSKVIWVRSRFYVVKSVWISFILQKTEWINAFAFGFAFVDTGNSPLSRYK